MRRQYLAIPLTILISLIALGQHPTKPEIGTVKDLMRVMGAEELAKVLQSKDVQKPVILYVGPHSFYTQAHVPGAEDVGPVAKTEGMEKLRARAKSLPHDSLVVIYCGCCPWDHCPNFRPAYRELERMGFSKLYVLYLPTSFGSDWAEKGFPVAKGE